MTNSPLSRSRSASPTHSNTKTRRSTVSGAFKNAGATATTITNSAVQYGNSTVKDRSMSKKASSPVDTIQKDISVVSVGTVTNPDATASELLAVKSPHLTSGTYKSPFPSSTVNKMSVAQPSVAVAASGASGIASGASGGGPGVGSVSVGAGGSQNRPARSPASTSIPKQPETMVATSSMADGQVSSAIGVQPAVGHGIVDVNVRTGAKLEMVFSSLGALLFVALWVYMLGFANCYRNDTWIFLTKAFSAFGVVASLFVLFHSCFERRFTIGRGIFGCIIFFVIAVVIFLNLVDAFMAMNCMCRCGSGANAFSVGQTEDLVIFFLSMAGAFSLIAVLLVSSVAHEDHHHHIRQSQ